MKKILIFIAAIFLSFSMFGQKLTTTNLRQMVDKINTKADTVDQAFTGTTEMEDLSITGSISTPASITTDVLQVGDLANVATISSIVSTGTTFRVYEGATQLAPDIPASGYAELSDYAVMKDELKWFNILDYDAKGDGTDDAPEIQAAIAAGAGGVIYIPTGTFYISSQLVIPSNTILAGSGWENTRIKARSNFGPSETALISFAPSAKNIRIKNICIDGNNANNKISSRKSRNYGISENSTIGHSLAKNVYIENVEITKTSEFGMQFGYGSGNFNLENCWIHQTGDTLNAGGIYIDELIGFKMNGCIIDSTYQHGIYYAGGSQAIISNSFFRYCGKYGAEALGQGISLRADSNIVITGNQFLYNSSFAMDITSVEPFYLRNSQKNVVITNNIIGWNESTTKAQIMISGVRKLLFSGNEVINNNPAWHGIRITSKNKDISILSNNIHAPYGIYITGDTIENTTIKNNVFTPVNNVKTVNAIRLATTGVGESMIIMDNSGDSLTYGVYMENTYAITNTKIKNNEWTNVTSPVLNASPATAHNIEYKGSSAFTTTADRKAIFIDGLNTDYDAIVTIDIGNDSVRPVAADMIGAYCKADSLIVSRIIGTGGTSGLKFKYIVNND